MTAAALSLRDGELTWSRRPLLSASEISLPGDHNRDNAMAAAAVCLARGVEPEAVAAGLRSFRGVPHRLETVAVKNGVSYVNDSKATNVASAAVALRSYDRRVHLIAGGRGKHQAFAELAPLVDERCAAVYLIGEATDELAGALAGSKVPVLKVGGMERAVRIAAEAGAAGATRCCCRRPVRAMTSTTTSRPGESTSGRWWRHSDGGRGRPAAWPPLEHRVLMTATLCLLAFGAVMVYSASSPLGVLNGQGKRDL